MEAGSALAEREAEEPAPDEEFPLEGEDEGEEAPEEPTVEGSEQQLSLAVGGRRPEESRLTLEGGELKVRGQFKKGERHRFIVEGVIDEVATRDHRDRKTATVTKTVRKHKLTIEGIEKL